MTEPITLPSDSLAADKARDEPVQTPETAQPDLGTLIAGFWLPFATSGLNLEYLSRPSPQAVRDRARQLAVEERYVLVREFAERVREDVDVIGLWATWEPSLDVIVTVAQPSLDRELRIQAIFEDLASNLSDPGDGELDILAAPYEPAEYDLIFRR